MPGRIPILLSMLLLLTGCPGEEIIVENEKVNEWIYGIMEENYLWSDYMPADWEENLLYNPKNFFKSLLYDEHDDIDLNDLYSKIVFTGTDSEHQAWYEGGSEYALETPDYHYGFAARLLAPSTTFCHITYVIPGSPADKAGIRRGDCFRTANGLHITELDQLEQMLEEDRIVLGFYYPEERDVTLQKDFYYDNPVYFDTVYALTPKTGYFVYNHFTDGDNNSYYNQLREVFSRFHAEGVEHIIADFRFNGGGELTAARKVASLLAPGSSLGGTYLYKERNVSFNRTELFEEEKLLTATEMQGYNCGVQSLYILTNKNTASASELVVHCLRPLYEDAGLKFVHAGEVTEGKNLGGMWYSNAVYQWEIYPITLRVHNVRQVSGYESGLVPDLPVMEYSSDNIPVTDSGYPYITLGQLGDIAGEPMLRRAMDDIYGIGGWQDLLPSDQQGAAGYPAETRSSAAYYSTGTPERTTVRYRPMTERRER